MIGNRSAILELASSPRALWVGALFVLSAGLARDYDGEDLTHEPWRLLIPFGASLAASFILFLVTCGQIFRQVNRPSFFSAYRSFLTLFWMTAPLAWLYAIPYERFFDPLSATKANLKTLALVAILRVLFMTRIASVLTGRSLGATFFLVILVADGLVLLALDLTPRPLFDFMEMMSGIRATESEEIVAVRTFFLIMGAMATAPIWLISGVAVLIGTEASWKVPVDQRRRPSGSLWLIAISSVLFWVPILPFTQSEQRLRHQVELDMKSGRIGDALDSLSAHVQNDFPPQWAPPPHPLDRRSPVDFLDVMEVLVNRDRPAWVAECYVEKFKRYLGQLDNHFASDPSMDHPKAHRIKTIARKLEEKWNYGIELPELLKDHKFYSD